MKPIQVGLLGIGTVGKGTFEVLLRNQEEIQSRAGRGIEIAMVADLDTARAREIVGPGVTVVNDARAVVANPDIDIVVELIGGYGIARELVMSAIEAGKHVVTANKALLAVHGTEIFEFWHTTRNEFRLQCTTKWPTNKFAKIFWSRSTTWWRI